MHNQRQPTHERAARRCGRVMAIRTRLIGVLFLISIPAGADERLALTVSPTVSFAPAHLIVRARISTVPKNRALRIPADSEDFYRASEVQLDGDKAARVNTFEFRSVPSGSYAVTAILLAAGGRERATARTQVNVFGDGHNR